MSKSSRILVQGTKRPNETMRKNREIKMGYVSQDEIPKYVIRKRRKIDQDQMKEFFDPIINDLIHNVFENSKKQINSDEFLLINEDIYFVSLTLKIITSFPKDFSRLKIKLFS